MTMLDISSGWPRDIPYTQLRAATYIIVSAGFGPGAAGFYLRARRRLIFARKLAGMEEFKSNYNNTVDS